ncbi:NAD(P)-dependent oxidoreductase [Actinophytocola sp.]|uniref:NAD(P)-dependent oxidoreductase n=1 Tax=Actinophytocola sp. TaxID=1872138 RepID=UPI002ED0BB9A
MRITVFGATGAVGREVVTEATTRGHDVRAASRASGVDATNVADVVRVSAGQDLVISATRPHPGHEAELAAVTRALLAGLRGSGTRLLLVGGAATLRRADGVLVQDAPDFPLTLRPIANACADQLAVCRTESEVDWVYLSPPMLLETGPRTGRYRLGADDLITDEHGESRISNADLAVVLLDEAERPRHRRTRFTVGY